MTFAVKRMIRLADELAFPVGANGGKGKQLFTVPDHKESLIAKVIVNSVGGIAADRPRVDNSFPVSRG
jgi:hypothetical protein